MQKLATSKYNVDLNRTVYNDLRKHGSSISDCKKHPNNRPIEVSAVPKRAPLIANNPRPENYEIKREASRRRTVGPFDFEINHYLWGHC